MAQTFAEQPSVQASPAVMTFTRHKGILARPWSLKWQICLTTLFLLFLSGLMIQIWNYKNFMWNEIVRTEEKHLVIAKNLSLSLSRYMTDVAQVFIYLQEDLNEQEISERSHLMMQEFNLDAIAILSANNRVIQSTTRQAAMPALPAPEVLRALRDAEDNRLFGVQVSPLQQIENTKYFILGFDLPGGNLAVAYLNTSYIKSLQQRIAFGARGHSAIFDSTGRAVAHPNKTVEANMVDASGISVVGQMLDRKEGVGTFYSPPMDADMIAGYTFVPETGWPVMVPQPVEELSAEVHASLLKSYAVAGLTALLMGFMGWRVAGRIVTPIERFTRSSQQISQGNFAVSLPSVETSSAEMSILNESLKTMGAQVKLSQDRLREALALEEEQNRRKNEFIVIASHELRTPLNGVLGMLSVCNVATDDPKMKKHLELALESARRLNRIVDNMVDFTEASANQMKISPVLFDANRSLDALSKGFAKRAAAKKLVIDYTWRGATDAMVMADREKIEKIAAIILDNAIKYSDQGRIAFSATTTTEDDAAADALVLSVTDTGIGMDCTDQGRLFEPFAQINCPQPAPNPFARENQGIGMSLCIAHMMATAMGGTITCTSKKNEGSTFALRIPVKRPVRTEPLHMYQAIEA